MIIWDLSLQHEIIDVKLFENTQLDKTAAIYKPPKKVSRKLREINETSQETHELPCRGTAMVVDVEKI